MSSSTSFDTDSDISSDNEHPHRHTYHKNNLKIIHYNAQSLRKKLHILETEATEFDIICITETWLNETINDNSLYLKGYLPIIRKDRQDGYGGVAMYVKNNLATRRRDDIASFNTESLWVEIQNGNFKLLLGCMYRPPNSKSAYWEHLESCIENAKSIGLTNMFICGDLNCNVLENGNKLNTILQRYHLSQLIDKPTHHTKSNATLLDIIATTCPDNVQAHGILPPSTSHHNPVYVIIKNKKPKTACYQRKIWCVNDADWEGLNNELRQTTWEDVLRSTDSSEMVEKWTETFINITEKYIPHETITVRPREAQWMTPHIRKIMRKRDRAHKIAKRRNTDHYWEKYRKLRNEVIDRIREAKDNQEKRQAAYIRENSGKNPKLWWKLVKNFYKGSSSTSNLSQPLLVEGKLVTSDKDKANELNNFFVKQTQVETEGSQLPLIHPLGKDNISMITITASNVRDLLQILNVSKACGPDGINPKILKYTADAISPILSEIFNFSLQSSEFLNPWKIAYVTALFKKGDPQQCSNYRPISLLSILSKVFERCVFREVFNFLLTHEKLSKLQAAYTPNSSTECQLLEIYNTISEAMEHGLSIRFVFCDVSKAFDRVWHEGLLHKLENNGVRGSLLKWFKSYLSDRQQLVVLNGQKSELKNIKAGVPQGSILGPLLFIVYMNDIVDAVNTNIRLYADDSTLFVIGGD